MPLEPFVIMRALKSRFATDTGSGGLNTALLGTIGARVYLGEGPPAAAYPFIWHQPLSILGNEALGPEHCGVDAIWQVGAVAKSENIFDVEAAMSRIWTLLHGWVTTAESTELRWHFLEWETQFPVLDGVKYREVLSRWAVEAQAA